MVHFLQNALAGSTAEFKNGLQSAAAVTQAQKGLKVFAEYLETGNAAKLEEAKANKSRILRMMKVISPDFNSNNYVYKEIEKMLG